MKQMTQNPLSAFFPCLSLCLSLVVSPFFVGKVSAQGVGTATSGSADVRADLSPPIALKLHFDAPVTFALGSRQTIILGDFQCGTDGAVYLPVSDDTSPKDATGGIGSSMMIAALTPSGSVVRFKPQDVPGFRNILPLLRYFVSSSNVYVLETADKIDESDIRKTAGRRILIEVFDLKGALSRTVVLEPGVDPVNLAAFESGEMLVLSLDRLNQTTRLLLFDASGRPETELRLFDGDFGSQLDLAAKTQSGFYSSHDSEALTRLLALASLVPHGENLYLATKRANFPVLEINQHGLVHTTKLALPGDLTLDALLPSDDAIFHAVAGSFRLLPSSDSTSSSEGAASQTRVFSPTEIDEFYAQDGSLLRRVTLPPHGPTPVCAVGDTYTFLSPREEDGRLQLIHAKPIR